MTKSTKQLCGFPLGTILIASSVLVLSCAGVGDEEEVSGEAQSPLILNVHNGADDVWTSTDRVNITYCIRPAYNSLGFADKYLRAVHEMYQATQAWERTAYVKFVHKSEYDATCSADSPVFFYVVRDGGRGDDETASAESFPPSSYYATHLAQMLWIGFGYDTLDRKVDKRTTQGAFFHELGHILGFRHEHIRPQASQPPYNYTPCLEPGSDPWRTITGYTKYDPNSVMSYGPPCGPLKDYALDATDKGAAFVVYPAPRRCEVWLGSTKLGQTTMAAPTSAADGEDKCKTYATSTFQKSGKLFATVERRSDHYRAIMLSSNSKPCSLTDSILLFTPGQGFRRPAEKLTYEALLGAVAFNPPDPWSDGKLAVTYGTEGAQRIAYLYDKTSGFMTNALSKNVSFCANDDSTTWGVVRAENGYQPFVAYTPQGDPLAGQLLPLVYGSYSLSIDGMGGDDWFAGGDGSDIFTDLTGNNGAFGYGGNDTFKLCNYDYVDCGSGSGDKVSTCKSDTTGTIVNCETRSTF